MDAVRPYDALLCDCDGVIRRWDAKISRDVEQAYSLPSGVLMHAAFERERPMPVLRGEITDAEWRSATIVGLADTCGPEEAAAAVQQWQDYRGAVDVEALALVQEIRANDIAVVLVTNQSDRLDSDLLALGLSDAFDAVVNSSTIGYVKPEPEILWHAAAVAGCPPERCVFVDDTLANVESARALGMVALHYDGVHVLRAAAAQVVRPGRVDGASRVD